MTSKTLPAMGKGLASALVVSLLAAPAARATTFALNSLDGAGEGFNDTTLRASEGGNPGTTLGLLRQNAFQQAANQWAGILNSSVVISADGNFDPLFCNGSSALVGQAHTTSAHRDFPGAPVAGTWFAAALANSLRGADISPGVSEIAATFNSSIDTGCLPGLSFYYGFDHNPPFGKIDFFPIALHELAHGLGITTFVDLASGAKLNGFNDIFMTFLEDHSTGLFYPAMTNAERVAASINTGNLHWVGPNVAAMSGLLSAGKVGTHVQMYAPNPLEPLSSVRHFDTSLTPDELMEPIDTGTTSEPITEAAFFDMHWPSFVTPTPTTTATPTVTVTPTTTPTPTATPLTCPGGPVAGCRTPAVGAKASLQYKDSTTDDAKDQLQWKWSKGSVTAKADFGNPLAATSYQFCIYDGASTLLFDATIPPGGLCGASNPKPCWKDKPKGFDYNDKDLTAGGINQLKLQEGLLAGKAQIQVKAKGTLLDDPALPFGQPVTVQLHNTENGVCWGAVYGFPATKNLAGPPTGTFKDKAD